MTIEKLSKKSILAIAFAGLAACLFSYGLGVIQPGFASSQTSVSVHPFFQFPGGSVIVSGSGFESNSNVTIYVKNVIAKVETQEAGEINKTVSFPDQIAVGVTETKSDGSLEWALGIPKDEVKVIERWINNSTGKEEVLKTVTTTYSFQGTVKVIVVDEFGNHASDELTIIRWISGSPY